MLLLTYVSTTIYVQVSHASLTNPIFSPLPSKTYTELALPPGPITGTNYGPSRFSNFNPAINSINIVIEHCSFRMDIDPEAT